VIPDPYVQGVLQVWSERQEKTVCRITGNSMSPLLRHGDYLTIAHGSTDIRAGDVAVFGVRGRRCAHLVVRTMVRNGRKLFLLKGNQCAPFDRPVSGEDILGKVIEARGSNGYIRLDAPYWKMVSRLLAIRSYIAGRRHAADSSFWKTLNLLSAPGSRLLSFHPSINSYVWRGICFASKIVSPARPPRDADDGGGASV
jgi:hypothetical protein